MALKVDLFAQGALPTSQQTLYKPSAGQSCSVKVTLVNTATTGTAKVNVYLKQGTGTARLITPKNLKLAAGSKHTTCYEEIGAGDSIEGYALVGTLVDYTINGVLKS